MEGVGIPKGEGVVKTQGNEISRRASAKLTRDVKHSEVGGRAKTQISKGAENRGLPWREFGLPQ